MYQCCSILTMRHFAVWEISINTKTDSVPLIRSIFGVLVMWGLCCW